ncbi:hypothetical protein [Noviherbaspirillum aerium]|uniref:hypothetical protein n=1 Tax=Noviherbaspirillum aerium TaxID=2588497 RepID=UPI00124F07A6|nr:hypothetical protein [Noviherbaspirillum aerium]
MNRVLKTFLLWLLIAALPIQGMAAVIKASCGPRHHDIPSAMMSVVEHHHDSAASPHQHDLADMNASADIENAATTADDSQNSKHVHKTSYCSACAACCVGAVAPPSFQSMTALLTKGETVVVPQLVSFTGFIPASLERPPKHFSA